MQKPQQPALSRFHFLTLLGTSSPLRPTYTPSMLDRAGARSPSSAPCPDPANEQLLSVGTRMPPHAHFK